MRRTLIALVTLLSIFALGTAAWAGLHDGLVAHYPLQGNAHDVSGNDRHGVVYGNCTAATDRYGILDGAMHFSTEDDWVGISGMELEATSFTVSAWVRTDDLSIPTDPVRRGNHANYCLGIHDPDPGEGDYVGEALFGFSSDDPPNWQINICRAGEPLTAGAWHLLTGVYDREAGETRLYVDGYRKDTKTTAQDPFIWTMWDLEIGNWMGTRIWEYQTFVGDVDDVRVYNRALSDCEALLLAWNPISVENETWGGIKALYR